VSALEQIVITGSLNTAVVASKFPAWGWFCLLKEAVKLLNKL